MHSLEIIKLQFEKELHTLLCISELFTNIVHELSLKNAWLPQFSFWISIILVKIYISCIIINQGKNTFELVGTVLNRQVECEAGILPFFRKEKKSQSYQAKKGRS